jgi:hypothetical protein
MHMTVRDPLSPEVVMPELGPLFPTLQRCLEFGYEKAHEYYSSENIARDPYHFAHTMRLRARLALDGVGIASEEEDGDAGEVKVERLPYSGISFSFAGYPIKVWKSDHGRLPVAGPSAQRQAYMCQQLSLLDLLGAPLTKEAREHKPNVVILWEEAGHLRIRLTVVVPESGLKTRDSVKEHWRRDVPDQITTLSAPPKTTHAADVDDIDDIEITRDDDDAAAGRWG